MSSTSPSYDDHFVDLLIQRSIAGLTETEQQEFENLAQSPKHESEMERYDLTVAALDLAFGSPFGESMPRDIQDRLLLAAGSFFRNGSLGASTVASADAKLELSQRRAASRFSWREAVALAVTAACVMLMLSGYNPFASPIAQPAPKTTAAVKPPTAAEQMQQFMESKPADLVQLDWQRNPSWQPDSPVTPGGQVVWSDSRQEGYMDISGLPENDPAVEQYQLWIFDTNKKQKIPPDGGVFDITAGKVVVPIKAHIRIDNAVQFAITIEKPGGVMQSDQKRLPLLASVE